ncbi:hypothetical protein C8F01DRAFT_975052 [Mycena amicta]|nr:hypothetical protein C8F01DRAFT_975052 [Mycena amicta]
MSSFLVRIVAVWFAFLLPVFATFKALSHRSVDPGSLERWAKYWCVLGLFVAAEYLEFVVSWFVFIYSVNSALNSFFLLFLALPQTEGSTYVFDTWLAPWLSQHETALDADILAIQGNVLSFVRARLASLWQFVSAALNKSAVAGQQAPGSTQTPASGINLESAMGLFRTFGPALMTAFQPAAPATPPTASSTSIQVPNAAQRAPVPADVAPPFPEPQHVS